jgi:hypothetical protein
MALSTANAYMMIKGRAATAGSKPKSGITVSAPPGLRLFEKWRHARKAVSMANHASTRTTQLHDRRSDQVTLDEVERVGI